MIDALSDREREVIRLCAWGANEADIATDLHIERSTAHNHLARIRAKLKALTIAHAVCLAIKHGFITLLDICICDCYIPPLGRAAEEDEWTGS